MNFSKQKGANRHGILNVYRQHTKAINTIGLEPFMNKWLQSEVTTKMQLKENEDDA